MFRKIVQSPFSLILAMLTTSWLCGHNLVNCLNSACGGGGDKEYQYFQQITIGIPYNYSSKIGNDFKSSSF